MSTPETKQDKEENITAAVTVTATATAIATADSSSSSSSSSSDGPATSWIGQNGHFMTKDYLGNEIDDGAMCSKLHKHSCCPGVCPPCNCLFHCARKCVSGKKRRIIIKEEGFDLDLTYLTDRIIVHGFPSDGIEHIYRNPRFEIQRFLDLKHKDSYLLYNFCCEKGRGYRPEIFHGRVERYPFKDHNIPPLDSIIAFANSTKRWLDGDLKHVVSMHCKAGKGRAGLMSCITLLRNGVYQTAKECMEHYDRTRVTNNKGLTVPSQRKVVVFYESLWRDIWKYSGNIGDVPADNAFVVPPLPSITIHAVEIQKASYDMLSGARVKIYKGTNMAPELIADSGKNKEGTLSFQFENVTLSGNFKIVVESGITWKLKAKKPIELWHNTLFMSKAVGYIDFDCKTDTLYCLDTTKDFLKKCGGEVVLRVYLTKKIEPFASTGTGNGDPKRVSGSGYEMVPMNDVEVTLGDAKKNGQNEI